MPFFQKIFKVVNLTGKVIGLARKSLMRSFSSTIYCVRGITLVETLVMSALLAGLAFGVTYFFVQNKTVMLSSSQSMGCQTIAKQALESVVSLGSRLYGYKVNHSDPNLDYRPIWLQNNDIILRQFPPQMYRSLFEKIGVSYNASDTPENNSSVRLIRRVNPSLIETSTSVLLINFVNALQYLYNSDPNGYFSAHGKEEVTMSHLETLKEYKKRFDLKNIKFYMKISPLDLTTNTVMSSNNDIECKRTQHDGSDYVISNYSCPTRGGRRLIVTRPRFHNPDNMPVLSNVQIVGNPDIGFELKVLVEYTLNGQGYSCEGMHLFSHQAKNIIDSGNNPYEPPFPVTASNLKSAESVDLTVDPFVSCDTDGGDYDDISLDLNLVNNSKHKQAGTFILCQMNSYCKSEGDGNHGSCFPVEGRWQMCEHIEPISGQSWTFRTSGNTLYFDDMQTDRRYELNVGEFSMAAYKAREKVIAKFYLDATRPTIGTRRIRFSNAVGTPANGIGGRNYSSARPTNWATPPNSTGKWIQCNQEPVHFQAQVKDQFTHNITGCSKSITREDGNGETSIPAVTKCIDPQRLKVRNGKPYCWSPPDPGKISSKCGGVLEKKDVQHGRHTVSFTPSDSCGAASASWDLVWDTDLPSTFKAQDFSFPNNVKWLKSPDSLAYPIETVVPAKSSAGQFPKHYSVDCDQNYIGSKTRDGGNGASLKCELEPPGDIYHDDGCNPAPLGVKYYHVCGEHSNGGGGTCKKAEWAVYAPLKKSCKDVLCDPDDLLCCQDATSTYCFHHKCLRKSPSPNPMCSYPKDGSQDGNSGCPNLGLYDCNYNLECAPGYKGDCGNKRSGNGCKYQRVVPGTCSGGTCDGSSSSCTNDSDCDETTPDISGTCSDSGSGGCREKTQPYNPSNDKCSDRSSVCP